eukprot:314174_1
MIGSNYRPFQDELHTKLLIFGYLKGTHSDERNIPNLIVNLIWTFIQFIFKYDICHSDHLDYIIKDGSVFQRGSDIKPFLSVGCSFGFNEGIHKWKVKISDDQKRVSSFAEFIGIASDNNFLKSTEWATNTKNGHVYGLYGTGYIGGNKGSGTIYNPYNSRNNRVCWQSGDVITLELNCNKCILKFWINKICVGEVSIEQTQTYYHVICTQGKNVQYSL